jgi:hypothetical protein
MLGDRGTSAVLQQAQPVRKFSVNFRFSLCPLSWGWTSAACPGTDYSLSDSLSTLPFGNYIDRPTNITLAAPHVEVGCNRLDTCCMA